jgi:hypothetical protein
LTELFMDGSLAAPRQADDLRNILSAWRPGGTGLPAPV